MLLPPRHLRTFLCLSACLAVGIGGRAEESLAAQYSLREWHAQDGLPSEDLTRVYLDHTGYLWLATARGLMRFDGAYFENLGPELKRAGGTISIRAMAETPNLGLVVADNERGTLAFREGAFRRLDFAQDKVVNSLFAEADGTLWASCDDQSLLRWHAGRTEEFHPNENSPHRLVAHFATDDEGRMWIAGGTTLARYEAGQLKVVKDEFNSLEYRVAASRNGMWILTVDRLLKLEHGVVREVMKDVPHLAGAHYVNAMHEDRQGTLWLGTRSQGLYALVEGQLRPVPTSGEAVTGIEEDGEGDIWVISNGGGLTRLRFRDFKIYDRSAGLGDNYSFTVSEDAEGSVWFGNRDGDLARLRHGRIETFATRPGQLQGSVTSVLPDGHGKVWVTSGLGVFKLDPAGSGLLEPMPEFPPKIAVAYVAKNGDYWVGLAPDRVGRYRDGKLETFGPAEGFVGRGVRAITEDQSGGILLGTSDGRLIRYQGREFTRIPLEAKEDALDPIQDIYAEPGTGLTWIATSGNGLYVLGGGRLRHILPEQGLLDANITTILPDDQGYLWFGSTVGIFSLRRRDLGDLLEGRIANVHPIIVGRDDGVHGLTCLGLYKPAAWKGHDGRLWFATRKGVVNFDPAKAITDSASPPASVASITCDDELQPLASALKISGRVRKLTVRFSVLCLSTPDRVQLKYRLDGFDSQWVTGNSDRTVTYPKLPPGQYRLRVMASLGNGVWNESDPALLITVVPLWWQTLWFRLAAVSALVALVIFVVRTVSHRRLRLRLEGLERESAIERERARIARNIHDDLGASLTRISLLTQTARRDESTPESRQLGQIYETVRQITRSMDEIVWAVNPKNDHLDGLVSYLVSYAQSFLRVANIRCRLDLPDHLPAASLTSNVRHNLYLCQKEALNNIVKHSGADEVTIAMRVVANSFTYTISDNGRRHARNGNGNGHG
ncbi:MAG TPA: two-component regulator propeller domain-containing protein, partial [Lacunisphaera sp.]